MTGIQERIADAVAEIETESTRDELVKCNRRIGILREQLKRQIAHREVLRSEIAANTDAAAHTDELLQAVTTPAKHGDPADEDQVAERWDGLS